MVLNLSPQLPQKIVFRLLSCFTDTLHNVDGLLLFRAAKLPEHGLLALFEQ